MTRRPGLIPVAGASGVAFLAIFGGLSAQLRAGHDPALGDKAQQSSTTTQPRRVLVRRHIIKRRVVHVIPAPEPSAPAGGSAGGSVPAVVPSGVAPSVEPAPAPAPAPVAPAPVPAPAPAPVTRSS